MHPSDRNFHLPQQPYVTGGPDWVPHVGNDDLQLHKHTHPNYYKFFDDTPQRKTRKASHGFMISHPKHVINRYRPGAPHHEAVYYRTYDTERPTSSHLVTLKRDVPPVQEIINGRAQWDPENRIRKGLTVWDDVVNARPRHSGQLEQRALTQVPYHTYYIITRTTTTTINYAKSLSRKMWR
jgi:hypothetical protein